MTKPNALHHLALSTGDIKAQIAFFSDVLGMQLVALYWMHGAKNTVHGFLSLNDKATIAFVQTPDNKGITPVLGVSHPEDPAGSSAPGTLQHLALNVDTETELLNMRDRIRSRGVTAVGPINHGFCKSIYFAGLEGLLLELSTYTGCLDPRAWIDPNVVAFTGITNRELEAYKTPEPFSGQGGAIGQPAFDPAKPHVHGDRYQEMLSLSDETFTAMMSQPDPPVQVAN